MLIKCSECNKEVSDKAHNCPHCGNPISKPQKMTRLDSAPNYRKIYRVGRLIFTPIFWLAIYGMLVNFSMGKEDNVNFWFIILIVSYLGKSISKVGDWFNMP